MQSLHMQDMVLADGYNYFPVITISNADNLIWHHICSFIW